MGKPSKKKESKISTRSPKVSTYFARETTSTAPTPENDDDTNMAPVEPATETRPQTDDETAPLTRKDFHELKQDILNSLHALVTDLMQPMQLQLTEIAKDLADTSKMAEETAELTLNLQEDLKGLHDSEKQHSARLNALENRWRQLNLKFRGLEEGLEQGKDLVQIMAEWLATVLKMEEARVLGALNFHGEKIQVLLDLSIETLDKRRSLKVFATKLYNARIRFRWSPTSDIQVFRDGTLHHVSDADTGRRLLQILKLQLTDEEEQRLLNT
ncbi:UNVERIFIED_CONTAM: hypothetical protein K2H54_050296 [Gekko kuhli]